jgi:hypothetical protein
VVLAGWITRLVAVADVARWLKTFSVFDNALPWRGCLQVKAEH